MVSHTAPRSTRRVRAACAALATAALLLTACGDDDAGSDTTPAETTDGSSADGDGTGDITAELDGREFVSTEIEGYDLVADSEIRLTFTGSDIGISAGCNTMGGAYTVTDGVLVADQLFMTEMACEDPLMQQDTWVAEFLAAGADVSLDGDTMTLTGESATITLVDREVAEPDLPLVGTEWRIDGLVSDDAVSSTVDGTEPTLVIEGNDVAVDTGCNSASGGVEIDEEAGTITFGNLATTLMLCEGPVGEQETQIFQTLAGEVTYEIESNTLSLTNVADPTLGLTATAT